MTATTTEKPKRRRIRRVIIVLVAVILCLVALCWLLPWLLMPEDLRRMQGTWGVVRIETESNLPEKNRSGSTMTITGSKLEISDEQTEYLIRLDPTNRGFSIYEPGDDNRRTFLGFTMRIPPWLMTPSRRYTGEYELTEDGLVLCVRDIVENGKGFGLSEWRKIHLNRK